MVNAFLAPSDTDEFDEVLGRATHYLFGDDSLVTALTSRFCWQALRTAPSYR